MVKNKFKRKDISKFLNSWDREISNLNIEVNKLNLKQKKERTTLKKNYLKEERRIYFWVAKLVL